MSQHSYQFDDLVAIEDIIRRVARASLEVYYHHSTASYKTDGSIVTDADLAMQTALTEALLKGLDRLVIGLILYDRHANSVYINPTAMSIIESHPALELEDGELILTNPKDDKRLRKAITDSAGIDPDDSWKQSVAIGITHPDAEAPLPRAPRSRYS